MKSGVVWLINHLGPYGVSALHNGILKGYSANITTNNLIVKNITMNDVRNNTEYRCGLRTQPTSTILQRDPTILYVAGEYHYTVCVCIMPNKNSLEVVKRGHNQVHKIETIGTMFVKYWQQQGMTSDCDQVSIMPNICIKYVS